MVRGGVSSVGATAPEDRFGPTIIGHNGAPAGMSVAAVPATNSAQVESFSSRGPVTHYFGPVDRDHARCTARAARRRSPSPTSRPPTAPSRRSSRRLRAVCRASSGLRRRRRTPPRSLRGDGGRARRDGRRGLRRPAPDGAAGRRLRRGRTGRRSPRRLRRRRSRHAGGSDRRHRRCADVTASSATLTGTVNPGRLSTVVQFEYGSAAGTETTQPQSIGAGQSDVQVSAPIAGLEPNTTYTYRVVAINDEGLTNGPERTFTTASLPAAQAETGAATAITETGATLAGTANPQGSAAGARFEYGTTTGIRQRDRCAGHRIRNRARERDRSAERAPGRHDLPLSPRRHQRRGHDARRRPDVHDSGRSGAYADPSAGTGPGPDPGCGASRGCAARRGPRGFAPADGRSTLRGRTLQLTAPTHVARATVIVQKGRHTLARRRARVRSGAMKLQLRWSDVRNGRVITVALAGSARMRIGLQAKKLRLGVAGRSTRPRCRCGAGRRRAPAARSTRPPACSRCRWRSRGGHARTASPW